MQHRVAYAKAKRENTDNGAPNIKPNVPLVRIKSSDVMTWSRNTAIYRILQTLTDMNIMNLCKFKCLHNAFRGANGYGAYGKN